MAVIADSVIEGLTFDDVLLRPGRSEVLPAAVAIATRLTRSVSLSLPIVASAMDTVTKPAWRSPWRRMAGSA
jgi:IMP dehydrogenase